MSAMDILSTLTNYNFLNSSNYHFVFLHFSKYEALPLLIGTSKNMQKKQ